MVVAYPAPPAAKFPGEYWVDGFQYAQTRAGIQAAIDAANAAGGGVVLIPADTTIVTDGTPIDIYSNVVLRGVRGSTILKAPASATVVNLIEFAGSYSTSSDLNADAEVGAITVTLVAGGVAATGIVVGSIIDLFDSTVGCNQNVRVIGVSGEVLTLSEPLAVRFDSATTDVYRLSFPVENLGIEGIKFDGNGNSGDGTRAIFGTSCVSSWFRDLEFVDFNNAAAMSVGDGYGVTLDNCLCVDSGDAGESDIMWSQCSVFAWMNVRSLDASGFGPQTIRCNYGHFDNVHVSGSNGRAFKHQVLTVSHFNNIGTHGAVNTYTGFSLADRSSDNVINNLQAIGNGAAGVWFEGGAEVRNIFTNVRSRFNTTRDLEIPATSDDNEFNAFEYGTGLISANGTMFNGKQTRVVTSDAATSSTSLVDITGLTNFRLRAGRRYRWRAVLFRTSNAATVGVHHGTNYSAGLTATKGGELNNPIAAPAAAAANSTSGYSAANNTKFISTTAGPSTGGATIALEGYIEPSADGTFAIRHASETATSTSTLAGSYAEVERLNI